MDALALSCATSATPVLTPITTSPSSVWTAALASFAMFTAAWPEGSNTASSSICLSTPGRAPARRSARALAAARSRRHTSIESAPLQRTVIAELCVARPKSSPRRTGPVDHERRGVGLLSHDVTAEQVALAKWVVIKTGSEHLVARAEAAESPSLATTDTTGTHPINCDQRRAGRKPEGLLLFVGCLCIRHDRVGREHEEATLLDRSG
eukprot:scaffold57253_cov32-Tisochrysis_lutea.AAC.2